VDFSQLITDVIETPKNDEDDKKDE
jgi:hypothetical protein